MPRYREDILPESLVEGGTQIANELDVLPLVFPDRHLCRLVQEHVRRLQDWVGEEAEVQHGLVDFFDRDCIALRCYP
jgi:hypothetical protein